MARSKVPKFGNWESENDVPYTVYFDKARKSRGDKMINPNDPRENPDNMELSSPASLKTKTKPEEPIVRGSVKQIHEHIAGTEDVDFRHSTAGNEKMRPTPPGGRVNRPNLSTRSGAGSEYSFDTSSQHPQARNPGRGIVFATMQATKYENNNGIRARPIAQEDYGSEKAAAIPKFGDWNEHDLHSAENFTLVFNKVREERNPAPGHVSNTPNHPSHSPRILPSNEPKKCCFPWW